jgi:hypothetical protein
MNLSAPASRSLDRAIDSASCATCSSRLVATLTKPPFSGSRCRKWSVPSWLWLNSGTMTECTALPTIAASIIALVLMPTTSEL